MTGWWSCYNMLLQEGVCRYSVWSQCVCTFVALQKLQRYKSHFPLKSQDTSYISCKTGLMYGGLWRQNHHLSSLLHFSLVTTSAPYRPGALLRTFSCCIRFCILICKMLTCTFFFVLSPLLSLFWTLTCVFFLFDSFLTLQPCLPLNILTFECFWNTATELLYLQTFISKTITSD